MKYSLPPLETLKVFEAAARLLSFSQAANELFLTKSAVTYQIQKLEQSLDISLFKRSVRQVYLTEAGQQLYQTTQKIFDELNKTVKRIQPEDQNHQVIIGATTYVAMRWLSPMITDYCKLHPDVSIMFQHSVNNDSFNLQNVDIAIQWQKMSGAQSSSELLEIPMTIFPVCSPQYIQSADQVFERSDFLKSPLNTNTLLCEDMLLDLWDAWLNQSEVKLQNPKRIVSDANVRTQAAIDGQGWILADQLTQRELSTGQLIAPFKESLHGYGYAIKRPKGRYLTKDVTDLSQWICENALKYI